MIRRAVLALAVLILATSWLVPRAAEATVSSTTVRVTYAGNGSTTAFSFPYYFLANADLKVYLRHNTTLAETLQTITTHYTVTGAGVSGGGTVTFVTAPSSSNTVVIYRDPALTQDMDLRDNDALPAEELEERLDKLTLQMQFLDFQVQRSLRLSDVFTGSLDMVLPSGSVTGSVVPIINAGVTGWSLSVLSANAADLSALTGGSNTALHYHDADRARANHTGTQLKSTISDFAHASTHLSAGSDPLSLTAAELAAGSVGTSEVIDGSLTTADLAAAAAITSGQIIDGTLTASDLSTTAGITTSQILDGTLTSADLSSSAGITGAQILDGTVGQGDIADGAVVTAKLDANSVILAKIQTIATNTLLGNSTGGSAVPEQVTVGSGLSLSGGNLTAIGGSATITVKTATATLGSGIFNTLDFSGEFALTETPANEANIGLAADAVQSSEIQNDTIVNADINSAADIDLSKLDLVATDTILGRETAGTGALEVLTFGATPTALGTAASAGTEDSTVARGLHVHAAPSVSQNATAHGATTLLRLNGPLTSATASGTTNVTVSGAPVAGAVQGLVVERLTNATVGVTISSITLTDASGNAKTFTNVQEICSIGVAGISGLEASDTAGTDKWYDINVLGKDSGTIDGLLNEQGTAIGTFPGGGYVYGKAGQPFYLASVRREVVSATTRFLWFRQVDNVAYREVAVDAADFVIDDGSATTLTALSAAGQAPSSARAIYCRVRQHANVSIATMTTVFADHHTGLNNVTGTFTGSAADADWTIDQMYWIPVDVTQRFLYSTSASTDVDVSVVGYQVTY